MKRISVALVLVALITLPVHSQWHEVPLTRPEPLGSFGWSGIYFVDTLHGWVVSEGWNYTGRTRDGGHTWDTLQHPLSTYGGGNAVYFADTLHGIAAGVSGFGNGPGRISRTFDGGQTWSRVTHPAVNSLWEEIAVVGDSLWVIGSYWDNSRSYHGLMLRTPVSSLLSSSPIQWSFYQYPQFRGFREISVVSPTLVWISGGGWNDTTSGWQASLVHTTNGGQTFSNDVHKVVTGTSLISEIAFADLLNGWLAVGAVPSPGYVTTNGGATWTLQTVWNTPVQFLPTSSLELHAADADLSGPTPRTRISKSTNGGSSWAVLNIGTVEDGGGYPFKLDNEHMWLVGGSSIWYYQPPINHPPTFASPPSDTTVYVDSVYRATLAAEDVDGDSIRFVLLQKPNFLQFLENSPSIRRLTFIGRPLAGDTGNHAIKVIAHDNRGGADTAAWTLRVLPLVNLPPYFLAAQETLAIRALHDTTMVRWAYDPNRGDTLEPVVGVIASGVSVLPNSQPQHDSTTVFIRIRLDTLNIGQLIHAPVVVRDLGNLRDTLHLYLRVLPVTSVQEVPGQPTEFSLSQNYPNPFNPSTRIRFETKNPRFVSLKVFDVLGREIATLVNEEMRAGRYERTFVGTGLASGVYIYRLEAGGFVQSKKLLLLK